MSEFYRMEGWEVRKCSLNEWADSLKDRWIHKTEIGGQVVSTVFLGLDHNFIGSGPPVLFETMVFPDCDICVRYCTFSEAVRGHGLMVERLRKEVVKNGKT